MGRIGRSLQLVGQSFALLMRDKELMVLPLISGVMTAGIMASFFFGFGVNERDIRARELSAMVPLFAMYVVVYAVGIFFQAAVVAGATERMRGGDPTVASALSAAWRRVVPIIMWAMVAATVGTILRAIQERVGIVGKIVVGLVGAAWSLATLFIVPAIVLEDLSIRDAFTRSVSVFKRTWGESFVGSVSLGAAGLDAWVTLVAITGLLAWAGAGVWALGVFFPGAVLLAVLFSALQGIYVAALYQYATGASPALGLDRALLAGAFVEKRR
jgi:uncharacterized membrane protein YeaQ/YmgE (transglycosylase-associated protein family)